jgi:glutathione peroxidase
MSIYDFIVKTAKGEIKSLNEYRGKIMIIVNTASDCGFTPQYKELQAMYTLHKENGLEILGFPCNQFGKQEPGSNEEIQSFCEINYGVTFPLFDKVDVNGPQTTPLYDHLKSNARGFLGSKSIKWNFTKFLVDRNGKVLKRYAPSTSVSAIEKDLKALL